MFDERMINILESIHVPNTYWEKRSVEYQYWFRSLLQKIDSSIIFDGLPEGWSEDFFHMCLWLCGYVCVFKPDADLLKKMGADWVIKNPVVFQPCTLAGYDFYYQPSEAVVANPFYEKTFKIHETAEILKLTPDFMGIFDVISFYSSKLAEISKGIDIGLQNAKMPCILSASNESQAATLKKVWDKIQQGESLVIFKDYENNGEVIPRKNAFEEWSQDYQKTYLVHNLLEDMQGILDSFYVEIGLPVAIEKKERLVTSEADFASAQSQARISCWMETLRESLDLINNKFGTDISAEVAYECKDNSDRNSEGSLDQ